MIKKEYMFNNKKYVLMFTHSNILIEAAGVEKYISDQIDVLHSKNVYSIVVFPISNSAKMSGRLSKGYYGIIIGNKLIDIVDIPNIVQLLLYLKSKGNRLLEIFIHHLKNYEIKDIESILTHVDAPIKYFVHDFFSLCSCSNLLKNDKDFCGYEINSEYKCKTCKYYDTSFHYNTYKKFFANYEARMTFIFPSEFTKKIFSINYPAMLNKNIVIPHLTFKNGEIDYHIVKNEIPRLAFVGAPIHHKGWDDFIKISEKFSGKYVFYHFGFAPIESAQCIEVPISFKSDGENAMTESIRKNNIDAVLMLTLCGETYCYTLFESLLAGAVPLSYKRSGNVGDTIQKEKLGITFENCDDLIAFLADKDALDKCIEKYKGQNRYGCAISEPNRQILDCIDFKADSSIIPIIGKTKVKSIFIKFIYRMRIIKRKIKKRKY